MSCTVYIKGALLFPHEHIVEYVGRLLEKLGEKEGHILRCALRRDKECFETNLTVIVCQGVAAVVCHRHLSTGMLVGLNAHKVLVAMAVSRNSTVSLLKWHLPI